MINLLENHTHWLPWAAIIAGSLAAMVFDLGARRIPNGLTGTLFLLGLAWAFAAGGPEGLAGGLLGTAVLALPYVLLFIFARGGAGDAKLMGALGAWLGVRDGAVTLVAVAASGLVLGIAFSISKKRFRETLKNLAGIANSLLFVVLGKLRLKDARVLMPDPRDMQAMPYGVAIFAGVCLAAGGTFLC